ncbi:MAG: SMC family ATPase [Bacillota bacterium]
MNIQRIYLKNFTSYKEADIDLSHIRLACLVGDNGAGKSSLLPDSVLYCLYGRTERSNFAEDLVRRGEKELLVSLEFILGGERWRVTRGRTLGKRGKSVLTLEKFSDGVWSQPLGKDIPHTQSLIDELLAIDYETLCSSIFVPQGRADMFTAARPAERLDMLSCVFGLQCWEAYGEVASEEANRCKYRVEALEVEIEGLLERVSARPELEASLQELDSQLEAQQASVAVFERELDLCRREREAALVEEEKRRAALQRQEMLRRELQEAERQAGEYQNKVAGLEHRLSNRDQIRAAAEKHALFVHQLKDLEEKSVRHAELQQRLQKIQADTKVAQAKREAAFAAAAKELERAERQAELLDTVSCDGSKQCEFLADARKAQASLPGLRAKVQELGSPVDVWSSERAELEREIKELGYDAHLHTSVRKKVSELEPAVRQAAVLETLAAQLEEYRKHLTETREKMHKLRAEFEALEVPPPSNIAALDEKISELSAGLQMGRNQVEDLKLRLAGVRHRLEEVALAEQRLEEARVESEAQGRDLYIYKTLERAFGRYGVPAMILADALPEIEAYANSFLGVLQEGRMRVRLETARETKSGAVRETLEVYVIYGDSVRPYATYSGAERFSVDLALRVAIAVCVARRWGHGIETMVIDEGAGVLDTRGRANLVAALERAGMYFPKIIFTTHVSELWDRFQQHIVVRREGASSRVVVSV